MGGDLVTGAGFVHCPRCGRLMLGQTVGGVAYPQPHQCEGNR
jgi:hypothetical protein